MSITPANFRRKSVANQFVDYDNNKADFNDIFSTKMLAMDGEKKHDAN